MIASINISTETLVSKKPDYIASSIDDEVVILSLENEEYYNLNVVGSIIWESLEEPKSVSNIIDMLIEEYEVTYDICKMETIIYIRELFNLGLLELSNR